MRSQRLVGALIALFFLGPVGAAAQVWPADDEWIVLDCGGVPAWDPIDDVPMATAERDVVGDAAQPAVYMIADAEYVYFRLRVDDDPIMGTGFRPFGWGVEMDIDEVPTSYELLIEVDGISNPDVVLFARNTIQRTADDPSDPVEEVVTTFDATTHARAVLAAGPFASSFGGTPDFFVDWAIDRPTLEAEGVTAATEVALIFGTSSNTQALNADLACHDGTSEPRSISTISTDTARPDGEPVADADGDGLSDGQEIRIGTDPMNPDSDGDGYSDGVEVAEGTDPLDPASVPDGSPSDGGIRGGPGGCTVGGRRSSLTWVLILVPLLAFRRRAWPATR